MPLHTIPLCDFKYAGDTLSGVTFKYDTRENINKSKIKLLCKKDVEIEKVDNTMLYKENIGMNKNDGKLIYRENIETEKTSNKYFHTKDKKINKTYDCSLNKQNRKINISQKYNFNIDDIKFTKEVDKHLDKNNIKFNKNKTYQLSDLKTNEFMKKNVINLSITINSQITKNNTFNLKSNSIEFVKNKNFMFDHFMKCKEILENRTIKLDRIFISNINKISFYNLFREFEEMDYSIKPNLFCRNKINLIDKKINDVYMNKENIRNIDKSLNNLLLYRNKGKALWIYLDNCYIDKVQNKSIAKNKFSKFAYKNYNSISKNKTEKEINYIPIINISKNNINKLMYIDTIKDIYLGNVDKSMFKDVARNIFINKENYLDRIVKINVFKDNTAGLLKDKYIDIFKNSIEFINNINYRNIFKDNSLCSLNKIETNIFKDTLYGLNKAKKILVNNNLYSLNKNNIKVLKDSLYNLNKDAVDIIKNIYNSTGLEVIKRWWILEATSPCDKRILPYDYNYSSNPVMLNNRIIDKHPISFMPYLENNKGIDLNYGLEEINLSIEIMLDMVNIVGIIVQHSASQFTNCSGQESIEFIMELLLDWLNLDTTITEMQLKGSREHYLRCYRWIRWEAEKVWFMADKDHTQDKMMGIKYAGILFANLLDYMKYHHFDIVPLWRNLKYMDIERQFNRQAVNGDLIKDLNKLKGKRHYYIKTQNLNKKER